MAHILPPAMLGILGGGQLGRMFTMAARSMGYRVTVLDPDVQSPAGMVADRHIRAGYDDEGALDDLASSCAAVTTEFENVPAEALRQAQLETIQFLKAEYGGMAPPMLWAPFILQGAQALGS